MAIQECPRCKTRLFVPNKLVGGYVNCPHCKGRLWVEKSLPTDATAPESEPEATSVSELPPPSYAVSGESIVSSVSSHRPGTPTASQEPTPSISAPRSNPNPPFPKTGVLATPPTTSPTPKLPEPSGIPTRIAGIPMRTAGGTSGPPGGAVSGASGGGTSGKAGEGTGSKGVPLDSRKGTELKPAAKSARKVARFIATEAAQSTLQLAPDGKLPELHLIDESRKEESDKKKSSLSPLALFGILFLSVSMSVMIVFLGVTPTDNTEQRAGAWKTIEENYFSNPGGKELKEYNLWLREAKQAHQSQDYKTERDIYRKLLDRLRSERSNHEKGLTGSNERDKKLEECILILQRGVP